MKKSLIAGLIVAASLVGASSASAQSWAPAATAAVHPGVMTYTDGAQCTANFVYTDSAGAVYIGQAAHCSGTGGQTDTDGCTTASLPLGTPIEVTGASQPGTLVYSSWIAMQAAGETGPDTCAYNDIGLIKLDPADYGKVTRPCRRWAARPAWATRPRSATRSTRTGTPRCARASRC